MTLFLENPVGLSAKRHGHLSLNEALGLSFAARVDAVPVNTVEMPQACLNYLIVFSIEADATPMAVLELRDGENLFVNDAGEWLPEMYVPASVRRYPFMLTGALESDQLFLCIDEVDSVFGKGQRLFETDGSPSSLVQNAMEFCMSFHAAEQQTQVFAQALADSGLLMESQVTVEVAGGRRVSFSGFRVVDEQKLAELDDAVFLDWRRKGYLMFLYAHLFSGAQWSRLRRLLDERLVGECRPAGEEKGLS